MSSVVILLYVKSVVFKFDDCTFVVVHITVIRSRKNSNHCRKFGFSIPFVQLISVNLRLVSSYDTKKFISL